MAKTKLEKNKIIEDYIKRLEEAKAFFIITPTKINPNEANELRKTLKDIDSSFSIIKNTLFKIAAKKAKIGIDKISIQDQKAIVFCNKDASQSAKIVYDFLEDIEKGEINSGLLDGNLLDIDEIEQLAKLPSRNIMLATTVRTIASPLSGLLNVLNANITNLIYALKNISEKNN